MPAIHKGAPKVQFQFVASKRQSVLGGLPAVEALAQQFDLWGKLRRLSPIDPRRRACETANSDALFERMVETLKQHADFSEREAAWKHGDDSEKQRWLRRHLKVFPVGDTYLLKFTATAEQQAHATLVATLAAEQYCELNQLSPRAKDREALAVEILEKGQPWPWPEPYSNPVADGLLNVLSYVSLLVAGAGIGWIGFVIKRASQAQVVA